MMRVVIFLVLALLPVSASEIVVRERKTDNRPPLFCTHGYIWTKSGCVPDTYQYTENQRLSIYYKIIGNLTSFEDQLRLSEDEFLVIKTSLPNYFNVRLYTIWKATHLQNLSSEFNWNSELIRMTMSRLPGILSPAITDMRPEQTFFNGSVCSRLEPLYFIGDDYDYPECQRTQHYTTSELRLICFNETTDIWTMYNKTWHVISEFRNTDHTYWWEWDSNEYHYYIIGVCYEFYHTVNQNCLLSMVQRNYTINEDRQLIAMNRTFPVHSYIPMDDGVAVCRAYPGISQGVVQRESALLIIISTVLVIFEW